jgi:hypothetical protein
MPCLGSPRQAVRLCKTAPSYIMLGLCKMALVLLGTPSSLFFERLLYGKIKNLTEFPVRVGLVYFDLNPNRHLRLAAIEKRGICHEINYLFLRTTEKSVSKAYHFLP